MSKKTVTFDNPDALANAIRALDEATGESLLRQASVAGARVVMQEVVLRAQGVGSDLHARTGTLLDSILIAYDKEQSVPGKVASYIVTFGKDGWYWRLLEYGTSKMSAKPFFRPSFDAKREDAIAAMKEVIDKKINEAMNVE